MSNLKMAFQTFDFECDNTGKEEFFKPIKITSPKRTFEKSNSVDRFMTPDDKEIEY